MTDDAAAFVAVVEDAAGSSLRDVWLFDEDDEACLYIRDDIAEALEGHAPGRYIDNERYGYVTRQTYDDLTYATYEYTVRGFDEFRTFRTFLVGRDGERFGVLASVDRAAEVDFGALSDELRSLSVRYEVLAAGAVPIEEKA